MNNTIKTPQKSSNPLKNSQNRGNSERLSDNSITSPIEDGISKIKANFGKISQNSLNFAARVLKSTAQKTNTHQKTTASNDRRGFTLCN